ncbi:MAG TPA: hypothetical protein VD902_08475 [Symbiobacteriaceae bacterium]|nr:hypothetical protein [Symbiobacteriaceae bacterium]
MDIGFWDAVVGTFRHLAGLIIHLMVLFRYILGAIVAGLLVYFFLIRPLWGAIVDRGKRIYWAGLLFMIVFGLFLGPILIVMVLKAFGDLAALGAVGAYGIIIWLTYKVSGAEKIEH